MHFLFMSAILLLAPHIIPPSMSLYRAPQQAWWEDCQASRGLAERGIFLKENLSGLLAQLACPVSFPKFALREQEPHSAGTAPLRCAGPGSAASAAARTKQLEWLTWSPKASGSHGAQTGGPL